MAIEKMAKYNISLFSGIINSTTNQQNSAFLKKQKNAESMIALNNASTKFVSRANTEEIPQLTLPPKDEHYPLPWPHQAPGMTEEQIKKLNSEVFIINNYQLYVATDDGKSSYFHGGLDIVLPKETKIYAMEDGYVKSVTPYSVIISKSKNGAPCYGWQYTHIGGIKVKEGDYVPKGAMLGAVEFEGLPHLHLSRIFSEGEYWGKWHYECMPDKHFNYVDNDPPLIKPDFYFFENEKETRFPLNTCGVSIVKGDVDIVVPMREVGSYSCGRSSDLGLAYKGIGDRLGVSKIEYEIVPVDPSLCQPYKAKSFDFDQTKIKSENKYPDSAYNTNLTKVVFKHWKNFEDNRNSDNPQCYNFYSYYIITNSPLDKTPSEITIEQKKYSWPTNMKNLDGTPRFPDGLYRIAVTAYDFKGNSTSVLNTVIVNNNVKNEISSKSASFAKPIDNSTNIVLNKEYKGVAVLASEVGSDISPEEIKTFVKSCKQNFVIIDFAWITYHFPNTNLKAVNDLVQELQKEGVTVAAMYRPRALAPREADVHYETLSNGKISTDHNSLCYAYEDSRKWGVEWGAKILKSCPALKNIILYNIMPTCQCDLCKNKNGKKYIEQFLKECRNEWTSINPDIKIGHVGLEQNDNLYADLVDFICPFVVVNKSPNESALDISSQVKNIENIKNKYISKPIIPLAKICFSDATNNTTEDIIDTIKQCDQSDLGYCLWDYSFIFHNEENKYNPAKIINAMDGDLKDLLRFFKTQMFKQSEKTNKANGKDTSLLTLPPKDEPYPLPWPHQAPDLTPEQIQKLNEDVWIVNNYMLYQGDDNGKYPYIHNALDIALPNGTPIYAMEDGYVKFVEYKPGFGVAQIGKYNDGRPCYGWGYTHIGNIKAKEGQFVPKGTLIGVVEFKGIEHIHLSRIFSEGEYWGKSWYDCMPEGHFNYVDTRPPIIGSNFYFFENESEKQFPKDSVGRSLVKNDVDIIVPAHEVGEYSHNKNKDYCNDRLAVAKIEYKIEPLNVSLCPAYNAKSFDFNSTNIKYTAGGFAGDEYDKKLANTIYKHWKPFEGDRKGWSDWFSYYIITNSPPDKTPNEISLEQSKYSWKTNQKNPDGSSRFPNGVYKITVTVYDYKGHSNTVSNEVVVDNK